jgi:TonB family protein
MKLHRLRRQLAAAVLLLNVSVMAQEVDVMTFTPPMPDNVRNPSYPEGPLERGEEGIVELQFMVNTAGKPFEIAVTNSTGSNDFRREALRAIERNTYIPAMINGEPTVGSHRTLIRFFLLNDDDTRQVGASQTFIVSHRDFLAALPMGKEAAEEELRVLEAKVTNHYEDAYLNLARYRLAKQYGTALEQMRFLHAALGFAREASDASYLPEQDTGNARRELFKLQVANRYFREAIDTFKILEAAGDTAAIAVLTPAYEEIETLRSDARAYGIPITLNAAGLWDIGVLKRNVYVEEVSGKVNEFKLRCSQQYVGFAVEADVSYNLPEAWGNCSLEIIGEPGSSFTLVQH